MLKENDEIFCLFKEYKQKITQDAEKNDERVYGVGQMASRLALSHIIHKTFQDGNVPPTARKINTTWSIPADSTDTTSSNTNITWGRTD